MRKKGFIEEITYIEEQLRKSGYDPYAQLHGFLQTGDDRYITRTGNARAKILELDWSTLREYVMNMNP